MEKKLTAELLELKKYWDGKSGDNLIGLVDYCIDGKPLSWDLYHEAVIQPNLLNLDINSKSDFLEIGCGTGLHLSAIEKICIGKIAGTDLSSKLLSYYNGRAEVFSCAAHQQPFEDASFDRVLMFGVALYFPSKEYFKQVMFEIKRLLRHQGKAVVGDLLLLGNLKSKSNYSFFDIEWILNTCEDFGFTWKLMSQNPVKRQINQRYDLLLEKK